MVETLSRNTRLKLDQTLGQWRHWHCEPALTKIPVVERRLSGGLSNHSVLVFGSIPAELQPARSFANEILAAAGPDCEPSDFVVPPPHCE